MRKFKPSVFIKHETKQHLLLKFLILVLIFFSYFLFISLKYGFGQGFFVSLLTWSFFVFCTPIADAGFLLDFPLRLFFKIKMFTSEIFVWIFALFLNLYFVFFNPEFYDKTKILFLFKNILFQPIPYWIIIFLSMLGTFVSIRFGDELFDTVTHKQRSFYHRHKYSYKMLIMVFIFVISLFLYNLLLKNLGIEIPL